MIMHYIKYQTILKIGIEILSDTKNLINIDDKLPDDITFKNTVILMT